MRLRHWYLFISPLNPCSCFLSCNTLFLRLLRFFLCLILIFHISLSSSYSQDAHDLCRKMIAQIKQVQSLKFTFRKEERINGKMMNDKSFVKLQVSPFMVYYKQEYPKEGLELLYVQGSNDNQALINTNGFPYINVNLDPYGNTVRENQHHTVHNMGLGVMAAILEYLLNHYSVQAKSMVKVSGQTIWDGNECYIIAMDNPNFKYENYTVKKDETLLTIASRRKLSEHMILEKNRLDDFTSVSEGQVIKIPTDYAKSMILYLDKKRLVPLVTKVYDDIGLYELYEYYGLELNCKFDPEEFKSSFKDYNF